MPVYNQERYVLTAIQSILSQTYRDFEFIAVDDGSTDATVEKMMSVRDPRFRVVRSPHAGFVGALKRGVEESRGRWVARMDSDDISHPERLQVQMEFLAAHPECVFLGTAYGYLTPNDLGVYFDQGYTWRYVEPEHITLGGRGFGDPSVIFDRKLSLEVGLYDEEFQNENPLWYKMLKVGKGAVLGRVLFFNRWRLGSLSRSNGAATSRAHVEIRRRYDTANAARLEVKAFPGERLATFKLVKQGISIYLSAGDLAAARELAWRLWRRWPLDFVAVRLLLESLLGTQHLRFWAPKQGSKPIRIDPIVSAPK